MVLTLTAIAATLLNSGCFIFGGSSNVIAAITSAANAAFTVGVAGTFQVTTTGKPAPTLTESGNLPSGVTFNATTGALSGTPAAGTTGTYNITFTATNGVGTPATQNFTLSVVAAPAISSFVSGVPAITAGGATTLTATFSGGTGSTNNGAGTVTSGTPVSVSPTTTTT
ncbi:MAG: putative Ig domain-containing protein, partial [Acidobacteria bacterium]|nr:putative Ig domain-containing protein [Acidobacteriota bacterium]